MPVAAVERDDDLRSYVVDQLRHRGGDALERCRNQGSRWGRAVHPGVTESQDLDPAHAQERRGGEQLPLARRRQLMTLDAGSGRRVSPLAARGTAHHRLDSSGRGVREERPGPEGLVVGMGDDEQKSAGRGHAALAWVKAPPMIEARFSGA